MPGFSPYAKRKIGPAFSKSGKKYACHVSLEGDGLVGRRWVGRAEKGAEEKRLSGEKSIFAKRKRFPGVLEKIIPPFRHSPLSREISGIRTERFRKRGGVRG